MSRKRQNNEKLLTSKCKKRNISQEDEASNDIEMVDVAIPLNNKSLFNRSGKINKIVLTNFMCHSNLSIQFNKSCNLLIGNNGSGKSAILTALIVALGSKSSATNRCTSIAQLIKRGESSGSVVIHIANNCEQGYDRETYGSEIIVQRSFSSNGSSNYLIKKSSGQVVSRRRKDLIKILLFMNIQVENPVCVLNQDASRSFLKESDPKKRYKFFLKATQIDTAIEKLDDCISHYEKARKQLTYQKNLLGSLKDEVDKIQTKFNSLQAIGSLKEVLNNYKLELAWLKVQIEENMVNDINEKLCEYQQTYDALIETMNDRRVTERDRRARCEVLTQQINVLTTDMNGDIERKESIRNIISKDEEARNEISRQLQRIVKKKEKIETNIEQLMKDMSESSESQRGRIALEKEANEKKLETLIQRKGESESIKDNNTRDIEMMRNTKFKLEENINKFHAERLSLVRRKDKINAEISRYERSENSLSLFGSFMPELINAIEQLHRKGEFHQLPRGPLGRYIEVTDEKFTGPVEGILGQKVMSYCVNDAKDREVLNRLFAKMSSKYPDVKKCSIITSKFNDQVYDVSRGKVQSVNNGYCVLDVIKCSEPIVTIILIDHCKVESILFAEDEKTGFSFTAHVENVPHNLLKVIVLKKQSSRYLQVNMKQRKEG